MGGMFFLRQYLVHQSVSPPTGTAMSNLSALRRATVVAVTTLLAAATAGAQTTYTWLGTEGTQSPRVNRNGIASNHLNAPKAYPGNIGTGTHLFRTFSFVNTSAQSQAFFVDMIDGGPTGTGAEVFFVAYLNVFNPLNLSQNYLGDAGSSCVILACFPGAADFSVLVGGNQTVVLNVHRVPTGTAAGGTFTFNAGFGPATVVPEPSTYALLATGLAGLATVARRRRRA
jgi:hypothetical protein